MRKLATFAFSFSCAIFLSQYFIPHEFKLMAAALMITVIIFGAFFKGKTRAYIVVISASLMLGFLWNSVYTELFFRPALELDGKTCTVDAEVLDFPEIRNYGMSINLKVEADGTSVKTVTYFYDYSPRTLLPGDEIELTATFSCGDKSEDGYLNVMTSKGYYLTARNASYEFVSYGGGLSFRNFHRYASREIKNIIGDIFPESTKGFVQAFLTGDRSIINDDARLTNAMQRTGVYHIIAVSGLHVSVLTGFVFFIIGRFRHNLLILFPVLLLFMAISGFAPSVVRAVIMQIFLLTGIAIRHDSDQVTSLSAALFVLLVADPFTVKNVGLQLSFAATLGMILVTPRMYDYFTEKKSEFMRKNRFGRFIFKAVFGSLSTSVGAMIFTLPLSALYFGYVSLIAPIMNILILWIVTPAFCLSLTAVAIGVFSVALGEVAAMVASLPVWAIIWAVKAASKIPNAAIFLDSLATVIWFIIVYLIIFIFAVGKIKMRYAIMPMCFAVISLSVILITSSELRKNANDMAVTVLDVGQGQSIVITCGDYIAVVDCGSTTPGNAGETVYRYLSGIGVDRIDMLVLTHFHDDHANGAADLINYVEVSSISVPADVEDNLISENIISVAEMQGTELIYVTEDIVAELGDLKLNLYAPIGSKSENERCIAVLATVGEFDFVVTGDMNSDTESILIHHADFPDIEAMVAGHHGSKKSTSQMLIDTLKPETVVISVGNNTYGHPAQETLDRLKTSGIDVYRTDEEGHIKIVQGK